MATDRQPERRIARPVGAADTVLAWFGLARRADRDRAKRRVEELTVALGETLQLTGDRQRRDRATIDDLKRRLSEVNALNKATPRHHFSAQVDTLTSFTVAVDPDRPYACAFCSRSFRTPFARNRHEGIDCPRRTSKPVEDPSA